MTMAVYLFDKIFCFATTIIDPCINRLHFPITLIYIVRADAITVAGQVTINGIVVLDVSLLRIQ